ncbi:hypothetical protein HK104_009447 [Borealophlyctis nickersoniae]|nr:hypothetical protein HK104_009447 [Borealophlyctis nickersoniae]
MMRKDFVTSSSYNRAMAKERRHGDNTSTAQDSYKKHDTDTLQSGFERERSAYHANKSRANQGGEWWGDAVAEKDTRETNYKASFAKDDQTAVVADAIDRLQHRRKKPVERQPSAKSYNILTGSELDSPLTSSDRYDPARSAKRVSMEKMSLLQQQMGDGKPYNIITNLNSR